MRQEVEGKAGMPGKPQQLRPGPHFLFLILIFVIAAGCTAAKTIGISRLGLYETKKTEAGYIFRLKVDPFGEKMTIRAIGENDKEALIENEYLRAEALFPDGTLRRLLFLPPEEGMDKRRGKEGTRVAYAPWLRRGRPFRLDIEMVIEGRDFSLSFEYPGVLSARVLEALSGK